MLLALDIGFSHTGWSVWERGKLLDFGCIHTEKSKKKSARVADDNAARCAKLARELNGLIDEFIVQGIVGELPSGGAQSAAAIKHMAMASGVVAAVAVSRDIPVEWATPTDVKKAITGKRSATKNEIMDRVCSRLKGERDEKPHGRGKRVRYTLPGFPTVGPKDFEHVADSMGAYWALQDDLLVRTFG